MTRNWWRRFARAIRHQFLVIMNSEPEAPGTQELRFPHHFRETRGRTCGRQTRHRRRHRYEVATRSGGRRRPIGLRVAARPHTAGMPREAARIGIQRGIRRWPRPWQSSRRQSFAPVSAPSARLATVVPTAAAGMPGAAVLIERHPGSRLLPRRRHHRRRLRGRRPLRHRGPRRWPRPLPRRSARRLRRNRRRPVLLRLL